MLTSQVCEVLTNQVLAPVRFWDQMFLESRVLGSFTQEVKFTPWYTYIPVKNVENINLN